MTNFLIGTPGITRDAVRYRTKSTWSTKRPVTNAAGVNRGLYAELAATQTEQEIVEYDLGAGNTDTADHFIIGRADMFSDGSGAKALLRQSDASFFSSEDDGTLTADFDANFSVTAASTARVSAWSDRLAVRSDFTQGTTTNMPWLTRADNKENRICYSDDLSESTWNNTTYGDAVFTPADRFMTAPATTNRHGIMANGDWLQRPDGIDFILEAHVEYDNNQYVYLGDPSDTLWHGCVFDIQNGTVSGTPYQCSETPTITAHPDGGYVIRVQYTIIATGAGGAYGPGLWLSNVSNSTSAPSFTAAGTERVKVYRMSWRSSDADSDLIRTTDAPQFRGINGNRALQFCGGQDLDSANTVDDLINNDSALTYLVIRPDDVTAQAAIFNGHTLEYQFTLLSGDLYYVNDDGSTDQVTQSVTASEIVIARARHASGTIYLAIATNSSGFGSETSIASGNTAAMSDVLHVASYQGASQFLYGAITRIITTDNSAAITAIDNMLIAQYLTDPAGGTYDMSAEALAGPRSADYVDTFTETSAKRYWWIELQGDSSKLPHDSHSFGAWFDFGKEPDTYSIQYLDNSAPGRTDSGASFVGSQQFRPYRITVTWKGITNTIAKNFREQVLDPCYKHRWPLWLRATSPDDLLAGHQLIQVRLEEGATIVPDDDKTDRNTITATFTEVIG